jgi:hypothetical protein
MADFEYVSDRWTEILQHNHANGFDNLWTLDAENWFEPPNYRRGGWSGVVRTKLSLPAGGQIGVFIKRQENHVYHSWRNLFFPATTFIREYRNLVRFRELNIPSLELIYFGQRTIDGNLRAILVTEELEGYSSLEDNALVEKLKSNWNLRKHVLSNLAMVIRHMHDRHMQHNCLYPKHIFVKPNTDNTADIRLIDLEKAKWRPSKKLAMLRDLGTLHRHAHNWSSTDRLRLFTAYREERKLSKASRVLLSAILKRMKQKKRGKANHPVAAKG